MSIFFFFAASKAHLSVDDNHSFWHLKYNKQYPYSKKWKLESVCDTQHCWPVFKDMKMQIERACYSQGEGVQLRGSKERRKPWQRNSGLCRLFKSPEGVWCANSSRALEQGAIGTPSSTGHLSACPEIVYPGSREHPSQCLELKRRWCLGWNTIFM